MNIAKRSKDIATSLIKKYGPSKIKKVLWDKEFSSTKWDFMDDTSADCVYPHLERYLRGGSILDLGCGPGNTANELSDSAYGTYVGLDISQAALDKGIERTKANGRQRKNNFAQGDFLGYKPTQKFDVILFRESLYHVPFGQVKAILDKYAQYLNDGGVFIVRLYAAAIETGKTKSRVTAKMDLIRTGFDVVEEAEYENIPGKPTVLIFRPRS